MAKAVWLAYNLGVRGDYEGLFGWLDAHHAKECGDSAAFLHFSCDGPLADALTRELQEAITISKNTRIYAVWQEDGAKLKGRFIIGRRKAAPWSGYADVEPAEVDEE